MSRGYGLSRGSRYRQIDTIQDEIRRLDNQKEVSIEEIKLILIKFISRTGNDIKKIQKLKRLKRKINDGKERKLNGQNRFPDLNIRFFDQNWEFILQRHFLCFLMVTKKQLNLIHKYGIYRH